MGSFLLQCARRLRKEGGRLLEWRRTTPFQKTSLVDLRSDLRIQSWLPRNGCHAGVAQGGSEAIRGFPSRLLPLLRIPQQKSVSKWTRTASRVASESFHSLPATMPPSFPHGNRLASLRKERNLFPMSHRFTKSFHSMWGGSSGKRILVGRGVGLEKGSAFVLRKPPALYFFRGFNRLRESLPKEEYVHFRKRNSWTDPFSKHPSDDNQPKNQKERMIAILAILFVAGGSGVYVYVSNLEIIPYTKRRHLILVSPTMEKEMGENAFNQIKSQYRNKILPEKFYVTLRVKKISENLINAAVAGISREQNHMDSVSCITVEAFKENDKHQNYSHKRSTSMPKVREDDFHSMERSNPDNDHGMRLDDEYVEKSRKWGLEKGIEGRMDHLKDLKWEILVLEDPLPNAFCLPGGKIVFFTGLLEICKTDEEIATVLGHEVAHVIARHGAERLTTSFFLSIFQLIAFVVFDVPGSFRVFSDLLLSLPNSRMQELEADRIGLMVMAAAGYNPAYAPAVYKKLAEVSGSPEWTQYVQTHPSGYKRAQLLSNTSAMREATQIYEEQKRKNAAAAWGFLG